MGRMKDYQGKQGRLQGKEGSQPWEGRKSKKGRKEDYQEKEFFQAGGVYDDGQDGMMMDEDWAQDDVERDGDTPSQDEEGHVEVS